MFPRTLRDCSFTVNTFLTCQFWPVYKWGICPTEFACFGNT